LIPAACPQHVEPTFTVRQDCGMGRLAQTDGLTDVQQEILATVRDFVDKEILPHATAWEHADTYPQDVVKGMRELGLFGLMIDEEYGGLGESLLTYALVVEEIARGWMSVSGIINTHFIVAYMLRQQGTDEQKQRLLPRMATGEVRGAFSMSEPGCGSDVSAIRTRAVRSTASGRRREELSPSPASWRRWVTRVSTPPRWCSTGSGCPFRPCWAGRPGAASTR